MVVLELVCLVGFFDEVFDGVFVFLLGVYVFVRYVRSIVYVIYVFILLYIFL